MAEKSWSSMMIKPDLAQTTRALPPASSPDLIPSGSGFFGTLKVVLRDSSFEYEDESLRHVMGDLRNMSLQRLETVSECRTSRWVVGVISCLNILLPTDRV
jgi:hypothetical protein